MPTCFLNFSVISRNTLIAGASVARKVVLFEVSASCSRVSSEFVRKGSGLGRPRPRTGKQLGAGSSKRRLFRNCVFFPFDREKVPKIKIELQAHSH
jgi:hypothetical protein